MDRPQRRSLGPAIAAVVAAVVVALAVTDGQTTGEWRYYAGDLASTKYSPLDQINRSNVSRLRIAWRRPQIGSDFTAANSTSRLGNNYRSTPLMINGVLFATNAVGVAEAFDPETGRPLWSQKIAGDLGGTGPAGLGGAIRAVAHWNGNGAGERRIFTYHKQFLYALNPETGEVYGSFGSGGRVDLSINGEYLWNAPPLVVRDVVIVGSSNPEQDSASKMEGIAGEVRAFDARTGKLRWTFRVIPRAGEPETETFENEAWRYIGAGNVWAPMSADEELGYVYIPTTSPTNDMYGGHRLGNNLFSDSVVCLDAATGRRVWYFQTIHHDLFDYDNPAAPILGDITVNGRRIKAVVQVTKQAFAYVLDRVTGQPVWPIEERPVPASTVPGERASATQPFPTRPPAFDRQGVTIDDLIDFTPELRAEAIEIVKKYKFGPAFTPPSVVGDGPNDTKGTIQLPGSVGGADWTGAGFDPETGMLYVPSMTNPFVANLVPGNPAQTNLRYRASTRALLLGPRGLPLMKPPYGRITAIDLNRGEHAWMVPNGDGPRDHPAIKHLNLPPLGHASRGAVLVTKTLLFAPDGDEVNTRTPAGGERFRALDKATGATIWEIELPAGVTGAPMTYLHRGKQYIVVAIGGRDHPAEFVALNLPD
jgi:quinoprotein glucose dehydrogenase